MPISKSNAYSPAAARWFGHALAVGMLAALVFGQTACGYDDNAPDIAAEASSDENEDSNTPAETSDDDAAIEDNNPDATEGESDDDDAGDIGPTDDDTSDDDTSDDDTSDDDTSDDDAADDDTGEEEPTPVPVFDDPALMVEQQPGRVWACEYTCGCDGDYYAAMDQLTDPTQPGFDVVDWRDNVRDDTFVLPGFESALEFSSRIENLLSFSVDEALTEPTHVAVVEETTLDGGIKERVLLISNARLGEFRARVLIPAAPGPWPVMLAIPGHGVDTDEQFLFEQNGARYARDGYLIGALSLRVMCGDETEGQLSSALIAGGSSLAEVQMEEALQLYRYLRTMDGADFERVGLIAHSGGSAPAMLLSWAAPDLFDAVLVDNYTTFGEFTLNGDPLNETVPKFYAYHDCVYSMDKALVPTHLVPYGDFDKESAAEFFDRQLRS
ncbi:MAG: hypothetical protein H6684_08860 [Deltaproteobacteria bacterium]|nr:hypothetical protein [Deltaproteobacteria bacterium]MCB9488826.1 hypothetical protein [Deltaproteobacteria bacterium]